FPLALADASGDDSPQTVFQAGALRYSYDFSSLPSPPARVQLEVWQRGASAPVTTLKSLTAATAVNQLINLDALPALKAGDYQVLARAVFADGSSVVSSRQPLKVLTGSFNRGNSFVPENFNYSSADGDGALFFGYGGTDTLILNVPRRAVASFDGAGL